MRAGKKTEAEKGQTRPCIVYVKNLKESETTELINYSKQSKIVRSPAAATNKVFNKRINTNTITNIESEIESEEEIELEREIRGKRTSKRAASIANVELPVLPVNKRQIAAIGRTATIAASAAGRGGSGSVGRNATTVPRATKQTAAAASMTTTTTTPIGRRRNTEIPQITKRQIETTTATKMYKQSKLSMTPVAATPPPTIAASRSRRSIKPNPKYASEDMVTPKYVSAFASSDSPHKHNQRAGKHLFMDDDIDDEDEEDMMDDLIEEDNDDELNDVAFNPQMHKSDDDDDISDNEFEQQLRREKVPPKRGRGRPPKNPQAIAAAAAAQAARAAAAQSQSHFQSGRSMPQAGRSGGGGGGGNGGVTNLQQLRRTMGANATMARINMTGGSSLSVSNKRKLEDHSEAPIARKRMATETTAAGRAPPVINGSTSVAKTAAIGMAKSKVMVGNNNNNSNSSVRLIQAPNAKQRAASTASNFKMSTTSARGGSAAVGATTRTGNVVRQLGRPPNPIGGVKVQKATAAGAANTKLKNDSSDDVPTFTIVNINDIINQDDVLITRSSSSAAAAASSSSSSSAAHVNSSRKVWSAVRNNNNNNNSSSNNNNNSSNSRNNQSSSVTSSTTLHSTSSNNLSSTLKRLKGTTTLTAAAAAAANSNSVSTLKGMHHQQQQHGITKPRPRILNAEMGKKTPMMKPLMSMGKELCPMPNDGVDTEDEDMSNDLDAYITISPAAAQAAAPPASSATSTQSQRVVRRLQATTANKWPPNTRRNILATSTTSSTVNASNNQQLQRQKQQQLAAATDRKLTKLLGESSDDDVVFKKPASPSIATLTTQKQKQQQRRSKENARDQLHHVLHDDDEDDEDDDDDEDEHDDDDNSHVAVNTTRTSTTTAATVGAAASAAVTETESKPIKHFPPETTTYCEEDGRIVKKITCYETWHVISAPKESTNEARQQRTCLELPLVKLANVASRIKLPSSKWTSKVTLYKVSPSLMQRQTMTIFTGDLKTYNIPEEERHKYQPSCVLFRRSLLDRSKCRVPFDRAIIFKNKCFYANIEGKHVNLLGAPEVVNTVKDVELLIDIVDSLSLSSDLVEVVTSK